LQGKAVKNQNTQPEKTPVRKEGGVTQKNGNTNTNGGRRPGNLASPRVTYEVLVPVRTGVTSRSNPVRTQQPGPIVKKEICQHFLQGICKYGNNCKKQHPKKPELGDILTYVSSTRQRVDEEDGISLSEPNLPGLPALPPNGKCRIMGPLVIYFIPFYKPYNGIIYYKKIRLYRYNKTKQTFKLVFSYTKQGFHITTAAASSGYLVCSRLPFDPAVLQFMELAQKLKRENAQMKQRDERQKKEIADLKLETLQNRIFSNIRMADPVDLFVYDPLIKAHVQVLEYHKPADHVSLEGRTLHLWDKKTGLNHTFYIEMKTENVTNYNLDVPLQPPKLCNVF